ncbi:MAG: cation diffusion facilitator family transporter [bacterium]
MLKQEDRNELVGLGILTIIVNVTLMFVKIITGVVGNSYALIADGIESASDILSSLITWAGFHLSLKPADKEHPYGHGKFESLAGVFSGFSLITAAGLIAYNSVKEIMTPHLAPSWFTLPVLILVVVVKETLSRKVLGASDAVGSHALKGDAWHHRSDAITSAAVAIGITIALFGGKGYEMADDWGALLACIIILINGCLIIKASMHDVLDGSVDQTSIDSVNETTINIYPVVDAEKIRIRKSGIGWFVDMHVRVPAEMTIWEGHALSHKIKAEIMASNKHIYDVMIHLEPSKNPPYRTLHGD